MPSSQRNQRKLSPKMLHKTSQSACVTNDEKGKNQTLPKSLKHPRVKVPADGGNPPVPKTEEPPEYINNRMHISNIPFALKESDLVTLFSPYGQVYSAMIVTNDRGSKGFGFVTLDSVDSCERAKEALNGRRILGRIVEVRRATCPPRGRRFTMNNGNIVGATPLQPSFSPCGQSSLQLPTLQTLAPNSSQFNAIMTSPAFMPTSLSDAANLQAMLNIAPMIRFPSMFPVFQPITASDILKYSFGAAAQSFGALPNTAPASQFYPGFPFNGGVPGGVSFPLVAPNCQMDLRNAQIPSFDSTTIQKIPLPPSANCSSSAQSISPPISQNNSFMSSSMISHARLMQDQLVNMLNLDGTLNQSLFAAALNNSVNSIGQDSYRSLPTSSMKPGVSDESCNVDSRKRQAEGSEDGTPAKRIEGIEALIPEEICP